VAREGNSAALANLAVLLDASGKYQEAVNLYTKAITLSAKDYDVDMKGECARRLADQQALAR
jgi:Flp pilus assembly protein TadD